ncbi:MAG: type II toxin-antitoxin system RelE/ParE family toxin [Chloroflexota bacterium]|nr:type II toxin-antitoxin system RelE/ParE family toxin [Chloroflexota bacterium]
MLKARLTQLSAAVVLSDLVNAPGHLEALTGNRKGQFSMRLTANWRLVFEVADEPVPMLSDGGIAIEEVRSVRILEVVDYHER